MTTQNAKILATPPDKSGNYKNAGRGKQIGQCSGGVHLRPSGGDKPRPYGSFTTLKGRTTISRREGIPSFTVIRGTKCVQKNVVAEFISATRAGTSPAALPSPS